MIHAVPLLFNLPAKRAAKVWDDNNMAYSSCCEKSIVDEEADSIALAPLLFVVINTRREQKQCRRLNMALQLSHHYYTQFTSIQIHWRLNIHRGITNTIQYTQAGHFRRATKHNALQSLSGRTGPTSIDLAADHLLQTTRWYKKRYHSPPKRPNAMDLPAITIR